MKKKILFLSIFLYIFIFSQGFSTTFFSGYAGAKLNYSTESDKNFYSPNLKLQAFFAGQFNFSENLWSHLEISLDTKNLISSSLFHKTDSIFEVDELSLIYRSTNTISATYFSAFMGFYDPIGSDIFIQRYFGSSKISSKLTENWLGLGGSILYPHSGIGLSSVKVFYNTPIAIGTYGYLNHEDKDYYVVNGDLRFACAFRLFTLDFAAGIGAPLSDKYREDNVYVTIEKVYWHAGTTLLIGNNYTNSIFIQTGIYNATFQPNTENALIKPEDMYVLLEFRLRGKNNHVDFTLFSLPQNTVDSLLILEDTFGINANLYSNFVGFGNKDVTIGIHLTFAYPGLNFSSIINPTLLVSTKANINLTPYYSTSFLSGELHLQGTVRLLRFMDHPWYNCLSCDIGYRSTL